ncbi:hypothetical protein [Kitasatospora cineracea]|nr:hypothetical protein [Kitasatospora cineracea]
MLETSDISLNRPGASFVPDGGQFPTARRPACTRCAAKSTDERWVGPTGW